MVLSEQDVDELKILLWPNVNIATIHDDDYRRIEITFIGMKTRKSSATVKDVEQFVRNQPNFEIYGETTLEEILDIARRHFPHG